MAWEDDLKSKIIREIKLRSYNSISGIIDVIKQDFRDIEEKFSDVVYKGEPVIHSKIDDANGEYIITLMTLNTYDSQRSIRCTISGKEHNSFVKIEAIIPGHFSDVLNVAAITVGKNKARINFLDDAFKIDMDTEDEEFYLGSFDWMVHEIFEYKN